MPPHTPSDRKSMLHNYGLNIATFAAFIFGLVALTAGAAAMASPQAPTAPQSGMQSPLCGPNWEQVSSPNGGTATNFLYGVAAASTNDVWAVGHYYNGTVLQTLVEHWDGTNWSTVPSPNSGSGSNFLFGVAVVSTNDVWAAGYFLAPGNISQTLVEHWNGANWTVIPSPNSGTGANTLLAIDSSATNDIWAVGDYVTLGNISETLIEHWNGTAWTIASSPNPGSSFNQLHGVSAASANDVWAVGYYIDSTERALIEHWNGTMWSTAPAANQGSGGNFLQAVSVVSPNDAWAVGTYAIAGNIDQTLTEHWNGSTWSVVSSPNQGYDSNYLFSVSAASAHDAWAVGFNVTATSVQALIEHWNGSTWSTIPSQNPGSTANELYGVAAVSSNDVWAVGNYYSGTPPRTLIERYNPCPAGTPTQTATPGGPTPSATACTIAFTDVPPSQTFYAYIRCLACRGIVDGYSTDPPCTTGVPCFLPGNNVTRGQMAKFISNAANYQDSIPPDRQTFTDVPPSSTFWLYVERAHLHGVISGYSTNPPCTTGVPCFLPAANVTRGQTAKFVALGAGYADAIPPGQQTFTDVAPGSTFWTFIERVTMHGVVNGYSTNPPCTTGVPCFLPAANVTRGQTAKFISNAFFPDCSTPGRQ